MVAAFFRAARLRPFDANAQLGPPLTKHISCCQRDGPEELQFPAYGPQARINRGLYGVDLIYRFDLQNSGIQSWPVYAYERGRGNLEPYFGGGQVVVPGSPPDVRPKRGVPEIGNNVAVHHVRLLDDPGTGLEVPIYVPSQGSKTLEINIANAGACSTPFNLMVARLTIDAIPVGELG